MMASRPRSRSLRVMIRGGAMRSVMPCAWVHSTPRAISASAATRPSKPTGGYVHAGPQPPSGDLRGAVPDQCLQPRMQVCAEGSTISCQSTRQARGRTDWAAGRP